MIVEYIHYEIPGERQQEFEAAYNDAAKSLMSSVHCQKYELSHCVENPDLYILRIEWDSLDGHMKGFRGSREFGRFFDLVKPFFNDIQEMQHYEPTRVRGEK
ncbi:hypothetical protein NTE_00637 [Candidatus Nitrososphaera evergladensis SR1]|jgi:hemoglobin|uniref:ABM domain-containing protein n=1 Tax=Candidatus Nitrososphaera evergladensis SR1 TaxID=1459636 RepID=A0A075MPJ3_9ARCH|nr:antibiotic biosynthesis monooxygenase family protein [Candidatus Nitrososphaera evergladensis]AIF82717.1 hypothetical protein NTE_00637 [Candidatus Nitrososphaera evergladensis SR1]